MLFFFDLFPQLCAIRVVSTLISYSQKEDVYGTVNLNNQLSRVLTVLLMCLNTCHKFAAFLAEVFISPGSPLTGYAYSNYKIRTLVDVLSVGINQIVFTFYTTFNTLTFPNEVAPLLQQFVNFNH